MPFLAVDKENSANIDLYYEDHGAGRPVVLIHGWPLNGASWEKQTLALLEAGYRVITYDRRGFGHSSKPTFGYDYDTLTSDLHKLISHLDLRDAAIAGFSMGGGEVARYFGSHGHDRVSAAIFISAIPPFLRKAADNPDGVDPAVFLGIQQGLAADRPAFLTEFLKNFYNFDLLEGKGISLPAVQHSLNVAMQAGLKPTIDCVAAWGTDFRADLARIDVPTLVLHGDADRIVPIAISGKKTHEAVKGSQFQSIPGAPHGLLTTHADVVNRALLEFLSKTQAKSKSV